MNTTMIKECPRHGMTEHVLLGNGVWKCKECRKDAVIDIRRRNKIRLVEYKGGKCEICGYDKCIDALEFHHLSPEEKDFGLSCGDTRSLEKLKAEADKCIMVCANCHREIHANERLKKIEKRKSQKIEKEEQYFIKKRLEKEQLKRERKSGKMVKKLLDIDAIKKDIQNRIPKKEICKKYFVSLTSLKRFLKNNNIVYKEPRYTSKLTYLEIEQFISDFSKLGSFVQVSKEYGVSDKSIQKWCKRNGLPWRKKDLVEYIKNNK